MRLERAAVVLNDAIADLRQNLIELHHSEIALSDESIEQLFRKLAQNPHYNTLVNILLDLNLPNDRALSSMRMGHVSAIVNEALANIVRHANARNVRIQVSDTDERLQVVVKDNGIGFSPNAQPGYGLRNMRDRSRLLNGEIHFSEPSNKGTSVTLEIPWMD